MLKNRYHARGTVDDREQEWEGEFDSTMGRGKRWVERVGSESGRYQMVREAGAEYGRDWKLLWVTFNRRPLPSRHRMEGRWDRDWVGWREQSKSYHQWMLDGETL